jgi:hypothetical protein
VDFQPSLLPRASPPSPNHCNFNTNLRGSELQTFHLSLSSSCSAQSRAIHLPYLATTRILATLNDPVQAALPAHRVLSKKSLQRQSRSYLQDPYPRVENGPLACDGRQWSDLPCTNHRTHVGWIYCTMPTIIVARRRNMPTKRNARVARPTKMLEGVMPYADNTRTCILPTGYQ